ncbi:MAG: DUF2589 domain-containing protein [Planctomycetota bacterium]
MSVVDNMRGLPMGQLIGGPMTAAVSAQMDLSEAMIASVFRLAFTDGKAGDTRKLNMSFNRPVVDEDSGTISTQNVTIDAPLLGLVPIPSLLIDTVTVDFTMEVNAATSSKQETDASLEIDAEAKYLFFKASMKGKVSTHRENTRSTDNSAKYNVHVQARQQPAAEGMNKLMDLMASAVDPIKVSAGGGGGGG